MSLITNSKWFWWIFSQIMKKKMKFSTFLHYLHHLQYQTWTAFFSVFVFRDLPPREQSYLKNHRGRHFKFSLFSMNQNYWIQALGTCSFDFLTKTIIMVSAVTFTLLTMLVCQFNSIQFNLYFHIKNTQTSGNIKITKKQNMEEKTGRPIRPDDCPSLKRNK